MMANRKISAPVSGFYDTTPRARLLTQMSATESVPLMSKYRKPNRKRYTMDVLTTRNITKYLHHRNRRRDRLSLKSNDNPEFANELGEAIRAGDLKKVNRILDDRKNEALHVRFSFEVTVEKLKITYQEQRRKKSSSYSGLVNPPDAPDGTLTTDPQKADMAIRPLHLAIISQQFEIVERLLDAAKDFSTPESDCFKKILEEKVSLKFREKSELFSKNDQAVDGMNAIHLATKYHFNSLLTILDQIKCYSSWDETIMKLLDSKTNLLEQTPLHVAAKNFSDYCARALLQYGADVDSRDKRGFTPLHVASKSGSEATTLALLDYGADPKCEGNEDYRKTPLHRARTPKIAQLLLDFGADPLMTMDKKFKDKEAEMTTFEIFLMRNPSVVKELMWNGIVTNDQDLESSDLILVYDFSIFRHEAEVNAKTRTSGKYPSKMDEMAAHYKMVYLKLRELLKHPLAETYLHLKWTKTKKFFYINVLFYFLLTVILTSFSCVSTHIAKQCHKNYNWTVDTSFQDCLSACNGATITSFWVLFGLTALTNVFLLIRELLQAIHSWKWYQKDKENWLELCLIAVTFAYLILIFFNASLAQHFGAISVFLAWIDMTLLIGRFPSVGIYIFMAMHVMKLLLTIMMVYLTTLLAFAFAFHLLLPNHLAFDNPFTATLKVLVMMIGEFDFEDNFTWNQIRDSGSNGSAQALFVVFLFLASITISNLIVGLTVNKTEELFKEAGVIRLEKTVYQIMGLEDVLVGQNSFASLLPKRWKSKHYEHTQVFPFLDSVGNKYFQRTVDGISLPVNKICVQPFKLERKNLFMKDKELMRSSLITMYEDRKYQLYIFDEEKGDRGPKLNITLPGWIVHKTMDMIRTREVSSGIPAHVNDYEFEFFNVNPHCGSKSKNASRITSRNMGNTAGISSNRKGSIQDSGQVDRKGREIRDSKLFEVRRGSSTPGESSQEDLHSLAFMDQDEHLDDGLGPVEEEDESTLRQSWNSSS